jgi:hypothetical protein
VDKTIGTEHELLGGAMIEVAVTRGRYRRSEQSARSALPQGRSFPRPRRRVRRLRRAREIQRLAQSRFPEAGFTLAEPPRRRHPRLLALRSAGDASRRVRDGLHHPLREQGEPPVRLRRSRRLAALGRQSFRVDWTPFLRRPTSDSWVLSNTCARMKTLSLCEGQAQVE